MSILATIDSSMENVSVWLIISTISIFVLWTLSFFWFWQYSICSLVFCIPILLLFQWWKRHWLQFPFTNIISNFNKGFLLTSLAAFTLQFIGIYVLYTVHQRLQSFTNSWIIFLCIILAGFFYVSVEELLKLYFSLKASDITNNKFYNLLQTSTATSIGYGTCQGLLWTAYSCHLLDINSENTDFVRFLSVAIIVAIIEIPMHLLTGYLVGCLITKRTVDYFSADTKNAKDDSCDEMLKTNNRRLSFTAFIPDIILCIYIRMGSVYTFIAGLLLVFFRNDISTYILTFAMVLLPFQIITSYAVLYDEIKDVEKDLPWDYLQRVRQLSILGYGEMSGGENEMNLKFNKIVDELKDAVVIDVKNYNKINAHL